MTGATVALGVSARATQEQLSKWVESFRAYRHSPTEASLLDWLGRFDQEHLVIAHKILDAVIVVSELEIQEGYRDGLSALPGWSRTRAQRNGRWYFVGVGSAGESGPAMLRSFREANQLQSAAWQSFFINARELPSLNLSAFDSVVFVDDFAGTGKQITEYWNGFLAELVASEAKCYLLLTAVTHHAANRISRETEMLLSSRITLKDEDNVYSEKSELLSQVERDSLDEYGKLAWPSAPRGFGEGGLTLVLSHKTPNNSLPILHANNKQWVGPFPRNLIQAN